MVYYVTPMPSNYLNLTESAKMLGISYMTMHRWIKKGKLKPIIIGEYPLLTPEQLRPYVVQKRCLNCCHEQNSHCTCREICDMETKPNKCTDWEWKWD